MKTKTACSNHYEIQPGCPACARRTRGRPVETAPVMYARKLSDTRRALAVVDALVTSHWLASLDDPSNYGRAGDLAHVAELLDEIAEFLGCGRPRHS